MEQVRNVLASVRKHLGGLNATQKLLIGSLIVILLMTLMLVSQYAGTADMVELLPGATPEQQRQAAAFLASSNIPHRETAAGALLVPVDQRRAVQAQMVESGQFPRNSSLIFENLIEKQSWMNSRDLNKQIYKTMLENELAAVISELDGLKAAKVFLDIPEASGLGQTAPQPDASVTVWGDGALSQSTVDAVARMVAGAVSRLEPQRVTVTDGSTGQTRAMTDETTLSTSSNRSFAASVEKDFRTRIQNVLSHMSPPAVVEVTATVDTSRTRVQQEKVLPKNQGTVSLPKRESNTSNTQSESSRSAEPGVRTNTGADVNAGTGASGTRSDQTEQETEFENHIGKRTEQIDDPGGRLVSLVATVGVSRAYIAAELTREKAAAQPAGGTAPPPPTEAEIAARFETEKKVIADQVRPHLSTVAVDGTARQGEVVVAMVSGEMAPVEGGPGRAGGVGGGAVGTLWAIGGGGLADKVVLGVLALVSVGMMMLMIRRAGKRPEMPTAEELAGVPPPLDTKSDLVGEADESETAMAGIEVGEEEIKASKLREQVSELINKSPEVAGKMLNRWVSVER